MLIQKDIIKIIEPVKAGLNIGYNAPYSGYEEIELEAGTILRVSPYCKIYSDEIVFKCLDENISEFQSKYFLEAEQDDEYYTGFDITILKGDLENKYEIIEKADLTKLDFTKSSDMFIFAGKVWPSLEKKEILSPELQFEFKAILDKYEEGIITLNEMINSRLYAMKLYYQRFENALYEKLKWDFQDLYIVHSSNKTPLEIANEIISIKPKVIVINAEGKFGINNMQEFGGIEILKWLRIKHKIKCQIMLYGFTSAQQILSEKPDYLIIHAPGNFYEQLPFSISQIRKNIFKQISSSKLKEGMNNHEYKMLYKPYLQTAFNLEEFRHREANWWGIKCLWDVYKACFHSKDEEFNYPLELTNWLNERNTIFSLFLFEDIESNILDVLNKKSKTNNKLTYRNEIFNKINKIRNRNLKILHIDDQNKDGWCKIIRHMCYAPNEKYQFQLENDKATFRFEKNGILTSIGTGGFKNIDEFCNFYFETKKVFEETNWDIIILDLRLFPESDSLNSRDYEKLSGAVVLDLFKQCYKYDTTPILITSASNKIWSVENINKLGADAYWMKEGIDNFFKSDETINNFISLINLIEKLTDHQYKSLKDFSKWFDKFNLDKGWWNNNLRWKNHETIKVKSDEIEKLVGESIDHTRIYLQQFYLGNAYRTSLRSNSEAFAISNIINKIGNIVEAIHGIKNEDYRSTKSTGQSIANLIRTERGDINGELIRQERHAASHRSYDKLKWNSLEKVFGMVKNYLSVSPLRKK